MQIQDMFFAMLGISSIFYCQLKFTRQFDARQFDA